MTHMERALFTIDGETDFEGWHDPTERWNGFACPRFPLDTVARIAEWLRAENARGEAQEEIVVDGDRVVVRWLDGEDEGEGEALAPVLVDGTPLYPVGSYGWTWTVVEDC